MIQDKFQSNSSTAQTKTSLLLQSLLPASSKWSVRKLKQILFMNLCLLSGAVGGPANFPIVAVYVK